jgi:ribonuclease G
VKEIIINVESKESRCATLENGKLSELVVERKNSRLLSGNIYKGNVTNILHNIQSAFIDIGEGDNGFIHISDIVENTQKFQDTFDMDFDAKGKKISTQKDEDITKILKKNQTVLVQVIKESIGSKGARLTSNISIAGRYLVLLPNTHHRGVSRKITNTKERDRLKTLIKAFEMPIDMGLICRTVASSVSNEILIEEAHDLQNQWNSVVEKFQKARGSQCLFKESDLIKKSIMTALDKNYSRIVVDNITVFNQMSKLYNRYKNQSSLVLEHYTHVSPIFEKFHIEEEIFRALQRKVYLSCGGYLYFDKTEAMLTIDVNSGKSVDGNKQKNLEEALVQINLQAAVEIARQLRIRNVGGLIICDFIDMRLRKNQRRVLDQLKDSMQGDSAKCTILSMSDFGLVEMTRQRARESLQQTTFKPCPYCTGDGLIKTHESMSIDLEKSIKKAILEMKNYSLDIHIHPHLNHYIQCHDKDFLSKMADDLNAVIEFTQKDTLHLNSFEIYSGTNGKRIDV